jgi:hypothetical protein
MKTFLHFILTCLISTGALLSATGSRNPWPNFAIMAAVWTLFIWRISVRSRRKKQKQYWGNHR